MGAFGFLFDDRQMRGTGVHYRQGIQRTYIYLHTAGVYIIPHESIIGYV
jgi:hypothetical protein